MFSLDNICPSHTFVVKGLLQICPQDITKMLGSTYSNSGEWPHDCLCFLCYFSSEYKPLFIPIRLCFMKRHVYFMKRHIWRVSYFFHKMVNKDWNLFNISEPLLENSKKLRFSNFHLENSRTWIFTLWNHIL